MYRTSKICFNLAIVLISACTENKPISHRDNPFLVTSIEDVNKNGAKIKAEILNYDQFPTYDEIGFIISNSLIENPSGTKINLVDFKINSDFSCYLRTGIEFGKKYYVRSYAVCNGITTLGTEVSFTGKGCKPLPLLIEGISPEKGTDGNLIKIKGKNFGYFSDSLKLSIAGIGMVIDSLIDTECYARIPSNAPLGKYSIHISFYDQEVDIKELLEICSPVVIDYNPKKGFDHSLIMITGRFFGTQVNCSVTIHDEPCEIVSCSDSTLVVYSPETSFAGMTDMKVEVGGKFADNYPFEVVTYTIQNISPLQGKIGTSVKVTGEILQVNSFNPIVRVNGVDALTYNISSNSFNFIIPYLNPGDYPISIQVGGKAVEIDEKFNIENAWSMKYIVETKPISRPLMCQVGTVLYYGLGSTNEFWKYDITSKNWTKLSSISGLDDLNVNHNYSYMLYHNNALYVLLYFQNTGIQSLFKYQIGQDNWTKVSDTNVDILNWVVAYNDYLYGITNADGKVYRCDPVSGVWTYLYDFPLDVPLFHFVLGNKLYVALHSSVISWQILLYKLNIEEGILIQKATFPHNYLRYFSTNHYPLTSHGFLVFQGYPPDIWEYDPENNIWIRHQNFPETRYHVIVFNNEEKLHIGLGHKDFNTGTWKNDIWVLNQ